MIHFQAFAINATLSQKRFLLPHRTLSCRLTTHSPLEFQPPQGKDFGRVFTLYPCPAPALVDGHTDT